MVRKTEYDKKLDQIKRIQEQTDQKIQRLKAQASDIRKKEMKPVILSILDAMAQYDITVEDIHEAVQVANSFRKKSKSIKVKGRSIGMGRGKVDPKYVNRETGEAWSGRGKVPNWLREAERQGKSREFFLIDKEV